MKVKKKEITKVVTPVRNKLSTRGVAVEEPRVKLLDETESRGCWLGVP